MTQAADPTAPSSPRRISGRDGVRLLAGLLFLAAAALKAHQLMTQPTPEPDQAQGTRPAGRRGEVVP